MSSIPQFTSKFRVAGARKQRTDDARTIKRQRQTLACSHCQASKLRCDKARPCGSCVRRDGGVSCFYGDCLLRGSNKAATEDRLNRLEAMVSQLLNTTNASGSLHDSDLPTSLPIDQLHETESHGLKIQTGQYPTVVEDIMDSIHQLRLELPSTLQPDLDIPNVSGKHMDDECIFGLPASYSQQAILSQCMPSEKEANQLLATYFGGDTFIQPFIHAHNFQRQYNAFRADGFITASAFWLSTLFSIFSIAAMVPGSVASIYDAQAQSYRFQNAAGRFLVLGKYHNTQRDAPEALLLYAHCKGLRSLDPSHECGVIISIAVRHAYQLGYHRDPDVFGKFTVFEGEMRRRFWACCKQVDTMVSFQLGLPSNIALDNCDTKSPLNLLDSDFDIDTQVLPCPRPDSEATPILWFIVKDRLLPVFTRICQTAWSLGTRTDTEIMELDAEAKRAYSNIPDVLRWRAVADAIADPPFLIMCRLFLELLYLKSLCILHRKYMERGSASSICRCVGAACSIVRRVADVHRELQEGGSLQGVSWMFKGMAMTDFLLGAIVLCLYMTMERQGSISWTSELAFTTEEILACLREAHSICVDRSASSVAARKVSLAIQLTLRSATQIADGSAQALTRPNEDFHQELASEDTTIDFATSFDALTPQYLDAEGQLSFNELDPFSFMSDASTISDNFWSLNSFT